MLEQDPLRQPMWRRLLGVRALALVPVIAWLFQNAVGWASRSNALAVLPAWVERSWGFIVAGSLVCFLFSAAFALHDIVVHLIPRGRARTLLLLGHDDPAARQSILSDDTLVWKIIVLPMLAPLGLLMVGAVALFALGGADPILALARGVR
jgi:hypothetical protein